MKNFIPNMCQTNKCSNGATTWLTYPLWINLVFSTKLECGPEDSASMQCKWTFFQGCSSDHFFHSQPVRLNFVMNWLSSYCWSAFIVERLVFSPIICSSNKMFDSWCQREGWTLSISLVSWYCAAISLIQIQLIYADITKKLRTKSKH